MASIAHSGDLATSPSSPPWVASQHTDCVRRAAQEEAARRCRVQEFRVTPQTPLPARFRLVVFAVSTFGTFGSEALQFLSEASRRCGRSLPVDLLPQATWAAPTLAPFARMAVAFAARRGLAERVFERWQPAAAPDGEGGEAAPWEEADEAQWGAGDEGGDEPRAEGVPGEEGAEGAPG
jgi:hypothetical protein